MTKQGLSWQRASKLESKIQLELIVVSRLSRHGPLKPFILSSIRQCSCPVGLWDLVWPVDLS